MHVFEKIEKLEMLFSSTFPQKKCSLSMGEMLCHIAGKHNKTMEKSLTEEEQIFYDVLVRNRISPSTAYNWIKCLKYPEDLQLAIKRGKLSERQAQIEHYNRLNVENKAIYEEIMQDIIHLVEGINYGV